MKAVLFGASRGMGRAIARLLAARGDRLFLLEHVAEQLERSARDLEIYGARRPVGTAPCDLLQPETFAPALDRAWRETGRVRPGRGHRRAVRHAGGTRNERAPSRGRLLAADFTNTVLFCEGSPQAAACRTAGGTLCVFSSVAGERGRKPVVLYGAAKAGLTHYLEGLDHKFRARGLRTVCVKPGFVKTGHDGRPEAAALCRHA